MDARVQKVMRKIALGTPPHLQHVTLDIENTLEEERALAFAHDPHVSSRQRREIEEMVDRGDFRRKETIENAQAIKELDEYQRAMIKKYIRNGELPLPKPDAWMQERIARMEKMKR